MAKIRGVPTADAILAVADDKGRITVRVTPNASRNAIMLAGEGDAAEAILIRVTTTPEDGKANAAVLKLLAKALGIPRSGLSIVRGDTARIKIIQISH